MLSCGFNIADFALNYNVILESFDSERQLKQISLDAFVTNRFLHSMNSQRVTNKRGSDFMDHPPKSINKLSTGFSNSSELKPTLKNAESVVIN